MQKELLGSAEAFASQGDPTTGSSTVITAGIRKSLSKHIQAHMVGKLAAAQCDAYRVNHKLDEQASNVEERGDLVALAAMEPLLKKALAQAEDNVKKEQALLNVQAARLSDVKSAFDAANHLRGKLADLQARRGRIADQLPAADVPLKQLVNESVSDQADIAELNSRLQAASGWDVSVAAGVRDDLRYGTHSQGFIAVTATYSFGKPAADRAANKVAALTRQLLEEQRTSGAQVLHRAKETVRALIGSQQILMEGLVARQAMVDSTIARLAGVDTADGLRAQRAAQVEQLDVAAEMAAADARMDYLKGWLARNAD
ncbi:TPA: hypothetical protein QDB04_002257 [Burkholderia vietnamiensis]|nr:hypothetical protein [Burkholderia vietnamiensis]